MFFIFGWGRRTFKDQGPTLPVRCPHCSNQTWYHLASTRTWFTLFFIPVIPYQSRDLLLCPVCSRGLELDGDRRDAARRINLLADAFHKEEITEDRFLAELQGARLLEAEVSP